MPELPEVETIKRDLSVKIKGRKIRRVQIKDGFVLRTPPAVLKKALEGARIASIDRRGKALMIFLSNGRILTVQLMMTGQLIVDDPIDRHTRVVIDFDDGGCLLYKDQRRFGQLRVFERLDQFEHIRHLGPEPLGGDFSPSFLYEGTRGRRRPIKTLLLDHTFVAGIGNIYACELLFRAGVSPLRAASSLTKAEADRIHQETVAVLKEAIRNRGSSMRNYRDASGQQGRFKRLIRVYARENEACLRCRAVVKRVIQAGRSTFFCPGCQK